MYFIYRWFVLFLNKGTKSHFIHLVSFHETENKSLLCSCSSFPRIDVICSNNFLLFYCFGMLRIVALAFLCAIRMWLLQTLLKTAFIYSAGLEDREQELRLSKAEFIMIQLFIVHSWNMLSFESFAWVL